MTDNNQLLGEAISAALTAGAEILEVYNGSDFDVETKEDDSPLTLADRRAHRAIEESLRPGGLPILSEEGAEVPYGERRGWRRYWLIDPLDGTKEFIKRNGEFTVNVALVEQRGDDWLPVIGAVYVPAQDVLYAGAEDCGAFKMTGAAGTLGRADDPAAALSQHGTALAGRPADDAAPVAAVVSRSHGSEETEAFVEQLRRRYGEIERVSSGSSVKLCLVAEGQADAYPRFAPTMEWDTAAGDAVCRAAGCRVTGRDGATPLAYNKEDLHNPWFLVLGRRMDAGLIG